MTTIGHIVLTDGNPLSPRAIFFGTNSESEAVAWRDANAGGSGVYPITGADYAIKYSQP